MWRCRRCQSICAVTIAADLQRRQIGIGGRQVNDLAGLRALARVDDAQLGAIGQTQRRRHRRPARRPVDRTRCDRAGCRFASTAVTRASHSRSVESSRKSSSVIVSSSSAQCRIRLHAQESSVTGPRGVSKFALKAGSRVDASAARQRAHRRQLQHVDRLRRQAAQRQLAQHHRRCRQTLARMRALPLDQRRQRAGAFGAAIVAHRDAPLQQCRPACRARPRSARRDRGRS